MRRPTDLTTHARIAPALALALAVALGGCGKFKQADPREAGKARAEAKRQQAACGSSAGYDRLKGLLFDRAIGEHNGDRAKLDTLADYSFARMENPVVKGWDPALDIIRCSGRFILQLPPGAQRGFGGEHRLVADVDYTAQAAADGSGFVYQMTGAEPIVAKLAAFDLSSGAYRPAPAIDEGQAESEASEPVRIARADAPAPLPDAAPTTPAPVAAPASVRSARRPAFAPRPDSGSAGLEPGEPSPMFSAGDNGEATVRAFYDALRAGNGEAASAEVIPEKRSGRTFSPDAMSFFYGRLSEPIRLTNIAPLGRGTYRVRYRYAAVRSRCDGSAMVSLTNRNGRDFIRSIRALNGC